VTDTPGDRPGGEQGDSRDGSDSGEREQTNDGYDPYDESNRAAREWHPIGGGPPDDKGREGTKGSGKSEMEKQSREKAIEVLDRRLQTLLRVVKEDDRTS